jgi:hypothetical protein
MKTILKGLLVLFGLTSSIVSADFLGEDDDTYIGFQITTSLDSMFRGVFSGDNQYSYLFIQKRDGIKDGLALTQDNNGNRILGYLRPSSTFDLNQTRIEEYAVPIIRLETQDTPDTNTGSGVNSAVTIAVVGGLAALAIIYKAKSDLEDDWEVDD